MWWKVSPTLPPYVLVHMPECQGMLLMRCSVDLLLDVDQDITEFLHVFRTLTTEAETCCAPGGTQKHCTSVGSNNGSKDFIFILNDSQAAVVQPVGV